MLSLPACLFVVVLQPAFPLNHASAWPACLSVNIARLFHHLVPTNFLHSFTQFAPPAFPALPFAIFVPPTLFYSLASPPARSS